MTYALLLLVLLFFFSSRRRHTRCALVTGVQTCALPIYRISLGVTSAIVEGNAFLRARRERIRDANTATGTPVVFAGGRLTFKTDDDMRSFGDNLLRTLNAVREREIGRASCRARVCQYV